MTNNILIFHQRDERDELAEFLAANPGPWIVSFSPPSALAASLRNENSAFVCVMKATSYHDDGHTITFDTDDDNMGMGFIKDNLLFEKRMSGDGCRAIAFIYGNAAEPNLYKDGLDWPCWYLTISTVKKCYK